MRPTVIVLASGRGERFLAAGGSTHKLQARLGDKTVLEHTLDAVRASALPYHVEEAPHPGMGDSIAAGVRATADADGWMILPADLPLLQPETLRLIAAAPDEQVVVRPLHHGRQGHPVRFSRVCGPALMALGGAQGAAAVVRCHRLWTVAVDDVGCVTDIDTPQDLPQALAILRARQGAGA
jgi:molybdenum cofactor cytidylyltransferase